MRRGQMWSADFALSLLLFSAAVIISYSIITNTLEDSGFSEVSDQAKNAAALLAGTGYPEHWTNDTIIRAGLVAGDRLSLRKVDELAALPLDALRKSLRVTDSVHVHVLNASNATVGIFGECGIGDLAVSGTTKNESLPAIAIVGERSFSDLLENITVYENDAPQEQLRSSDIIVLEANFSVGATKSASQISRELDDLSETGVTFIIVGDPRVQVLGLNVSWETAGEITIEENNGARFAFETNELLDLSPGPDVDLPILKTTGSLQNFKEVGVTDAGDIAYGTWTYNDARVWYFGTVEGTRENGDDMLQTISNATQALIDVPRPTCNEPTIPTNAKQIAHHDRVIPYHDKFLTVRTIVWRTR